MKQKGSNGASIVTYATKLMNGVIMVTVQVEEKVLYEPVDEIVVIGAKNVVSDSPFGKKGKNNLFSIVFKPKNSFKIGESTIISFENIEAGDGENLIKVIVKNNEAFTTYNIIVFKKEKIATQVCDCSEVKCNNYIYLIIISIQILVLIGILFFNREKIFLVRLI